MRHNLPVTTVEHKLDDDEFIVSKTDLKGRITYGNLTFIRISGYSEEELVGAPHNLLRHPDMPAAAYDELWETIKQGREWRGIVKNRCKNGDYYWVDATVTPSLDTNGNIFAYMSVRRKATQENIEKCIPLYAQMVAEEGR